MGRSRCVCVGLTIVLGVLVASSGWAQGESTRLARAAAEIEEMTVTARKRKENVQEIPISITVILGAGIEEKGLANVVNLTETVPNLHVQTSNQGNSGLVIAMR